MTRSFVLLAHEAEVEDTVSLDSLPGHGRLDLVARFLNAALLTSHGVRHDTTAYLVLQNDVVVEVDGDEVRGLNPDERSIAGVLRKAISERGYRRQETQRGVYVEPGDLEDILSTVEGDVVWLHEDGDNAAELTPPENPVLVFSDHRSYTEDDVETLERHADAKTSLGPTPLHSDHAAAVTHNWLDTRGYRSY